MISTLVKKRMLQDAHRFYHKELKPDRALALCERIISEDPSHEEAQLLRLKCINIMKPKSVLIKEIESVLQIIPDFAEIWLFKGVIESETERMEEAEKSYKRCIGLDPSQYRAFHNLGSVQYKLGKKEEGISNIEKSLELNPDYQIGYASLLDIFYADGRYKDAIQAGEKASDLLSQNPRMISVYSMALYHASQYHQARIAFSTYIDHLKEKTPLFRYIFPIRTYPDPMPLPEEEEYIAATYLRAVSGLSEEEKTDPRGLISVPELEKVLSMRPGHGYAHAGISIRLIMEGDIPGACAEIDKALYIEPENEAFLVAKGFYLIKTDPKQAMEIITGVLQRDPTHKGALFGEMMLMKQTGKGDEALRQIKRLAKQNPDIFEAFKELITGEGKKGEKKMVNISEMTEEDGIKRYYSK